MNTADPTNTTNPVDPNNPVESNEMVLLEQRGAVLLITLNRPAAMNSINADLATALVAAGKQLDDSDDLRVGVLTGAGRSFCAGMDLKAFASGEDMSPMMDFVRNATAKPLVAALEGFALAGGFELALSCDLIVAAEGTKLGIPETSVGLFAAAGGLCRLPSRVGFAKAMEMALTADPITAEEAHRLGLVAEVVEQGAAIDKAVELAQRIATNAPLALAASKRLIWESHGISEVEFWDRQRHLQAEVFKSNDASEGARAFIEKRAPEWTGS